MGNPGILPIEYNDNDAVLRESLFKRVKTPVSIRVIRSGEDAISYLEGRAEYGDRVQHPIPDLVLYEPGGRRNMSGPILLFSQ